MVFCLKMKSDYSFLSSTITVADAISFCKENHLQYCSLIDNNLHGAMEFYTLCNENSIRPILGLQINILHNDKVFPLTLIAKNETGYYNLVKLSSLSNQYQSKYLELKTLALYSQDVILLIDSEDSYASYCLSENLIFELNEFVEIIKSTFKEIYFGIYRYVGCNDELLVKIKDYAKQVNIKCIANQHATHKDEKDTIILNLLDCIKKSIPANKDFLANKSIVQSYLKTPEQLKIFYDNDEIKNLLSMASSIYLKINKVNFSLPKLFENEDEKLKELSYDALKEKNLIDKKEYVERVEYELQVIKKMGFSNYYLVVYDYVNYAKNNNIPVGPARGSGGASLVAYLLNITTIDPIKYNLLFERFLNPSRVNFPDFDIDFSDIKRDQIIEYVKNKYGYRKVGYISTFSTFGIKSAIRDLARIMKISNDDVDYLVKSISNNATSINDEYKNNKKFKDLVDIHSNYKTLCSLASKIEGLKKQVGLHAAGMIISDTNLDEIVPCFEHSQNSLAIQYDYLTAEKLGLIKIDFLGLKNLSIIEYCIEKINKINNTNYNIDNFPFDDESSYKQIASGDTIGIFQLESEGMKNVISKLQPNCFDDIVALIALYRPGPMDMIETYIKRKKDPSYKVKEESLTDILSSTYGIIVYQEQIMQICQRVASYSLADADILRRAISKKNLKVISNEKERFIKGCLNNNYTLEKANVIFSFIEKFASYGFNKAHSVGYSKIAVMMAYIKANYKSLFYEALLKINNENGEKRKNIFYEAKKSNIEVLKPCVINSDFSYSSLNNTIRYGLTNILSIKDHVANIIINERRKETFNDVYDFVIRMVLNDVSLQVLEDLTYSGALDIFNIERSKLIANMQNLYNFALMFNGIDYQPNSYNLEKYSFINRPLLFKDDNETDYNKKEYEMLGIYISEHPISKIKKSFENITNICDVTIDNYYTIIGKITLIETRKTKDGKTYISVNLEDDTKLINVKDYNSPESYLDYKKGEIVLANISMKNKYCYLNKMKKVEVK